MKMNGSSDNNELTSAEERFLADVMARAAEKMPAGSRRDIRQRVLANVGDEPFRVQRVVFARAATALTVTVTLLGGVSAAAAASLPGDMLYGLKQRAEEVTVAVLPEGALERSFMFELAERRGDEADRLVARGASADEVERAIVRFQAAVSRAYSAQGLARSLGDVTAAQVRFMERIRTMAASVQAGYDAVLQAQPSGSTGSGAGSGTSGSPGSGSGSTSTPTPGSGGSGSPSGPSPSDDPEPGNGSTQNQNGSPGSGYAPERVPGSTDTSGGPSGSKRP